MVACPTIGVAPRETLPPATFLRLVMVLGASRQIADLARRTLDEKGKSAKLRSHCKLTVFRERQLVE